MLPNRVNKNVELETTTKKKCTTNKQHTFYLFVIKKLIREIVERKNVINCMLYILEMYLTVQFSGDIHSHVIVDVLSKSKILTKFKSFPPPPNRSLFIFILLLHSSWFLSIFYLKKRRKLNHLFMWKYQFKCSYTWNFFRFLFYFLVAVKW